jgi:uncharacterized protein VirK/YbjX
VTITYPETWGESRADWTRRAPAPATSPLAHGLEIMRERLAAGDVRKAVLFAAAFAAAPQVSLAWMRRLMGLRTRLDMDQLPFDLATKIYKPFFSRALSGDQRLNLLQSHYDITTAVFGRRFVRALLAGREVPLAELTGASGERYVIDALRTYQFKDEGEVVLSIYARSRPDKRLGNLVVTVGHLGDGETLLWIGGVQGVCGAKPLIDAATADLAGIRPKAILMEAAWAMLAALRYAGTPVRGLAAVTNACNIVRGRHAADYDSFWLDMGGQPTDRGYFRLPAAAPAMSENLGARRAAKWRSRLEARAQLTATFARLVCRPA